MAGSAGYKEKYLAALDEQEKLERKHSIQLELLKKALVNLSVAAKGQEVKLDASLVKLQGSLRGGRGSQVFDDIERLERVVAEFDQMRDSELRQTASHFTKTIDNLLSLTLPKELESKLGRYRKTLKTSITSYRSFGEAIKALNQFQLDAIVAASDKDMPFWQRMKKGRSMIGQVHDVQFRDVQPVPSLVESDEKKHLAQSSSGESSSAVRLDNEYKPSPDDETDIENVDVDDVVHIESAIGPLFTDLKAEDNYEKVANRISHTLKELVQSIDPADTVKRKIEIVLGRIERGMDWFSLAVTLEDIRDILMARYLNADEQFSHYLKSLNVELSSISEALGVAEKAGDKQSLNAQNFSQSVSVHIDNMHASVKKEDSLNGLQSAVVNHIHTIQSALDSFKYEQQTEEQSLAQQLSVLIDRVKSVEKESQKSREQLEEQRYKATHDPLTELPNREAYTERVFHELHRFKRYGHPLTLAICDIDHFKNINDTFGHQAGDKVLKLVAKLISTRLRQVDFVARYGGEEFVLVMPETTAKEAFKALEKMRAGISKTPFRFKEKPVTITMCFGICEFSENQSVESVFEKADKALYEGKQSGRNKCIIAT